jgi:hypothetical protein
MNDTALLIQINFNQFYEQKRKQISNKPSHQLLYVNKILHLLTLKLLL